LWFLASEKWSYGTEMGMGTVLVRKLNIERVRAFVAD